MVISTDREREEGFLGSSDVVHVHGSDAKHVRSDVTVFESTRERTVFRPRGDLTNFSSGHHLRYQFGQKVISCITADELGKSEEEEGSVRNR